MSSFVDDENIDCCDEHRLKRVILKRIYTELYRRDREARENGLSRWFILRDIIDACLKDEEKKLVIAYMRYFKSHLTWDGLLIGDDDTVKITENGRDMVRFFISLVHRDQKV